MIRLRQHEQKSVADPEILKGCQDVSGSKKYEIAGTTLTGH